MPILASRRNTVLLFAILILAAVLRMGWLGITEFKYDEATIARSALAWIHDGVLPTRGVTSSLGIPHPPLTVYLLAIPFAFTRNPAVAAALMGMLGVIAVWLTYVLGRRYFGEGMGLIAAALFAASPWAIFYSRKIWSQNIPAITLCFMLALYALLLERKPKALAWVLLALGALVGLHLGGFAFVAILILALVLHPRVLKDLVQYRDVSSPWWLWLAVGLVGMLILVAPYMVGIASSRGSVESALASVEREPSQSSPLFLSVRYAAHIATGYQFHALAGEQFTSYIASLPFPHLNDWPDSIELWLTIAGMVYVVVKAVVAALRRTTSAAAGDALGMRYTLLALWIILPVLMWAISRGEIYPHHFIQLYPAQHLALAILLVDALDWLAAWWPRMKPALMGLLVSSLLVLIAWQNVKYLTMLHFVSAEPIVGGHGRPGRDLWSAAQQARELAAPGHLPVVVHTSGDNPDYEGGAAIFDALLGDLNPVLIDGLDMDIVPAQGAYVWLNDRGSGPVEVQLRQANQSTSETDEALARLANGVDLLSIEPGVDRNQGQGVRPGESLRLHLLWRIWNLPPAGENYSFTLQLYAQDGPRWAQTDKHFLRSAYWHIGDYVLITGNLTVPAEAPPDGRYQVIVAMYRYLSETQQQGIDILDVAGNPAGQLIVIPLD